MARQLLWTLICIFFAYGWVIAETLPLELVRPNSAIPIRSSPPTGGVLGFPGKKIGTADKDMAYVVLGRVKPKQGFTEETWVRIAPVTGIGSLVDSSLVAVTKDAYLSCDATRMWKSCSDASLEKQSDAFLKQASQLSEKLAGLTWDDLEFRADGSGRLSMRAEGGKIGNSDIKLYIAPETIQELKALRASQGNDDSDTKKIFSLTPVDIGSRLAAAYKTSINRALKSLLTYATVDAAQLQNLTWQDLHLKPDGSGRLKLNDDTPHVYLSIETVHLLNALRALTSLQAYPTDDAYTIFDLPAEEISRRAKLIEWNVDTSNVGWAYWGTLGKSNFKVIPRTHTVLPVVAQE